MTLNQILKLSVAERIAVIEQIWDSINPAEIQLTEPQKKELDKRLSRIAKGETKFHTWEEVKKKLRSTK
jgi:putative addiction module component (TIGR02574 family)